MSVLLAAYSEEAFRGRGVLIACASCGTEDMSPTGTRSFCLVCLDWLWQKGITEVW